MVTGIIDKRQTIILICTIIGISISMWVLEWFDWGSVGFMILADRTSFVGEPFNSLIYLILSEVDELTVLKDRIVFSIVVVPLVIITLVLLNVIISTFVSKRKLNVVMMGIICTLLAIRTVWLIALRMNASSLWEFTVIMFIHAIISCIQMYCAFIVVKRINIKKLYNNILGYELT